MIYRLIITLCFLSDSVVFAISKVPKEFQLCKRSSPDSQQCINSAMENTIKAIAGGMEELEIPVLNPVFVSNFTIESSGDAIDLLLNYENCSLAGMANAKYLEFLSSFDKDDCYIYAKGIITVTMIGKYKITGRLLIFQLNGHGNANITLVNILMWHNVSCAFYEKDGLEFMNITNWVEDYHPEKVIFDLNNLVDGNEELSAQVLQVANENNLEVFQSFRPDIEKIYARIFMRITNNVFSRIPWRENIFQPTGYFQNKQNKDGLRIEFCELSNINIRKKYMFY